MRTQSFFALAGWLTLASLLPAQPINPGAAVELPAYEGAIKDASTDEFGEPGVYRNPTFYVSTEMLFWRLKPYNLDRPIVGSLQNAGADFNAFAGAGGLGDPNAYVLYGNSRLDEGILYGARLTGQIGFDDTNNTVLEIGGMYIPESGPNTVFNSWNVGNQPLSLLHTNVTNGLPGTPEAYPVAGLNNGGIGLGGVTIDIHSVFWGADVNLVQRFSHRHSMLFGDVLLGFRHQGLSEEMSILSSSSFSGNTSDVFSTRNLFYGGQVGGRFGLQYGKVSVQALSKMAIGANDQVIRLENTAFGPSFYTNTPNQSIMRSTRFGYISETTLSASWSFWPNIALSGGYSYIYWNRVVRPTDQIDSNINFATGTNPASPIRRDQRTEFWAQGAHVALEFMY